MAGRSVWVSDWTSASLLGPCTASNATSDEMSLRRTFPVFRATICSQSLALLAALTTSITLSSNRYTRQSSMNPPLTSRIAEYCAWPDESAPTSLQVMRFTNAFRSGPEISNSPMCDTSNTPTAVRTVSCSCVIPVPYCNGMRKPAKGTIFAPSMTW